MTLGGWHVESPGHWWARGMDAAGQIWRFELDRFGNAWQVAMTHRGHVAREDTAPSLDEAKQLARRWAR